MMDHSTRTTIDHETIRHWAEERGGRPVLTREEEAGLRIAFNRNDPLAAETMDWETFFRSFEAQNLALLYQHRNRDGAVSRFCRLVTRH